MERLNLQRFADTEAVQRYQEALYINVGAAGAAATYELFGTGVTKADESFDTKTKESRYINQRLSFVFVSKLSSALVTPVPNSS